MVIDMDYRGRKYYLVEIPYKYIDDLIMLIQGIIPNSKIHYLLDNKTTPYWASRIMVSCKYCDSEYLEKLLSAFSKIILHKRKFYRFGDKQTRIIMQFKELTKENLGQ